MIVYPNPPAWMNHRNANARVTGTKNGAEANRQKKVKISLAPVKFIERPEPVYELNRDSLFGGNGRKVSEVSLPKFSWDKK